MSTSASTTFRHLPESLLATLLAVGGPAAIVWALASSGAVTSYVPLLVIGLTVSLSISLVGNAAWKAKPGGSDRLFSELMIWGWLRRLRLEHRVGGAATLLGLDGSEMAAQLDPDVHMSVLRRLATSLESRDPYLHGHSRRVARYAAMIAKEMELSDETVGKVRTAAAVHDVGKLEIPLSVLNKPGKLTDDEFDVIKSHAPLGAAMVAELGDDELTEMVAHHHERLDGSGYPSRIGAGDIPLGARIIAVADTFDALTSTRAYRSAKRHKEALSILHAEAGTQLDPQVVSAFASCYRGSYGGLTAWALFASIPHRLWSPLESQAQVVGGTAMSKTMTVLATTAAASGIAVTAGNADPRDTSTMPGVQKPMLERTAFGDSANGGTDLAGAGGLKNFSQRASGVRDRSSGPRSLSRASGGRKGQAAGGGKSADAATPSGNAPSKPGDNPAHPGQAPAASGSGTPGTGVKVPGTDGPGASDPAPGKPGKPLNPGNSAHDGSGPGNSAHDGTGPGNSGHVGGPPGNSGHGGSGPGNSAGGGQPESPGNSGSGGPPESPGNSGSGGPPESPGSSAGGGKPENPGNSAPAGQSPGKSGDTPAASPGNSGKGGQP